MQVFDEVKAAVNKVTDSRTVNLFHDIGDNTFVSVKNGSPCVDIRKYWFLHRTDAIALEVPGISLKFEEFDKLTNHAE